MGFIVFSNFSKQFKFEKTSDFIEFARNVGFDGYELCVRDGFFINPDNALEKLPQFAAELARAGITIPMITGPGELTSTDAPAAEPLLAAMAKSGAKFIKIGYFLFYPHKGENYWDRIEEARKELAKWEKLAKKYNVCICCHTHSTWPGDNIHYLGSTCASMMDLIKGFDPRYIGTFIDTAHLTFNGEPFGLATAIVGEYLSAVALKDMFVYSDLSNSQATHQRKCVPAGEGAVTWSIIFKELNRINFHGPLSVHVEYKPQTYSELCDKLKADIAYLNNKIATALPSK